MWLNDMWARLNMRHCWSVASPLPGSHSVGASQCSVFVIITQLIPLVRFFSLLNFIAFPRFTFPLVSTGCIKYFSLCLWYCPKQITMDTSFPMPGTGLLSAPVIDKLSF